MRNLSPFLIRIFDRFGSRFLSDMTVVPIKSEIFLSKSSLLYCFVCCIVNMNFSESSADECSTIQLNANKDNKRDTDEEMKSVDCLQFTLK